MMASFPKNLIKKGLPGLLFCSVLIFGACSGNKGGVPGGLPDNFENLSDTAKVSHFIKKMEPVDVARIICDASIGENQDIKIDTFTNAVSFAYATYNGEARKQFSEEINRYADSKPMEQRLKLYVLAGERNLRRMGYSLGKEYSERVANKTMTAQEVNQEINILKNICGNDTMKFNMIMRGLNGSYPKK